MFLRPDSLAVLKDENCRRSLARYFDIIQNKKKANFKIAKSFPVEFSKEDSTSDLWKIHEKTNKEFYEFIREIDEGKANIELIESSSSYLDLKIEIARRILKECCFCVRKCKVNRYAGEKGFCGCDSNISVSTFFEHIGEEPELVPSGTIFTCGCTMRCLHCQNWTISQWVERGESYNCKELAQIVDSLHGLGCRNANLVGGDPTPWTFHWLKTFNYVNSNIPIVWNSNSYYSPETAELLAGFTDVYLLDFKYGPGDCALRISNAPNYWTTCTENHLHAKNYGELIIRVLVLPNHLECCVKPILNWISKNLGENTRVNIMFQYRPEWRAYEVPELRRRLTSEEKAKAIQLAKEAGLKNFIT
ncbi:MAG: radical SAM protein [Candidatus Bathyarchaeia archaeon]